MRPIGGYFEWEFPAKNEFDLHPNAILLNSGRHALEYILNGIEKINRLWIPYFTCDVILQPLKKRNIRYSFYHINSNLELIEMPNLENDEYLLYTNYYGIKDAYVSKLASQYGSKLIIDNAQALFCKAEESAHQIYSPRKFIGMPDGGIAVTSVADYSKTLPIDKSYDRCSHLLKRTELTPSEGYADFKSNSGKISDAPLSRMSLLSKSILQSVDLKKLKEIRKNNFAYLHTFLGKQNKMSIPPLESFVCPLVYPYWSDNNNLKKKLIEKNIFVATYWPNIFEWCNTSDVEYKLAEHIICIPIDQRYDIKDMQLILGELI